MINYIKIQADKHIGRLNSIELLFLLKIVLTMAQQMTIVTKIVVIVALFLRIIILKI